MSLFKEEKEYQEILKISEAHTCYTEESFWFLVGLLVLFLYFLNFVALLSSRSFSLFFVSSFSLSFKYVVELSRQSYVVLSFFLSSKKCF